MIQKAIDLVKKNSILWLVFSGFLLAVFIYRNAFIPGFYRVLPGIQTQMSYVFGLLFFGAVICFFAGFGNMAAEAANTGKVTENAFSSGVKRYFGKLLLLSLLCGAIFTGVIIIVSLVIYLPLAAVSGYRYTNLAGFRDLLNSLRIIFGIFLPPFVLFCYTAIFTDGLGVMDAFTKGITLGTKSYKQLVLLMSAVYLPQMLFAGVKNIYYSFSGNFNSLPLFMIIMLILTAAVSIFSLPMLFILYGERKAKIPYKSQNNNYYPVDLCPNCSAANQPGATFCCICGQKMMNIGANAANTTNTGYQSYNAGGAPQVGKTANMSNQGKVCPHCAGENNLNAAFCRHCAKKFE